jgi:hypothetical protein
MPPFPRTTIGDLSVSRMIIGTNWFLGYTHCTQAKGELVSRVVTHPEAIADIIEVFLRAGVDTIMCPHTRTCLPEAIAMAEQRAGRGAIIISTPGFQVTPQTPDVGFDRDAACRVLDAEKEKGVRVCLPHTSTTDMMVDRCTRTLRRMDLLCELIRERGMIPGLSTHMPESIVFADESGLDVETYIQPFNPMGYLMQLEVDWIARIIHTADKPVITIKGMAAGQLRPFQAMTFCWNAIRDRDMITVGTMAPEEAAELIDMSQEILAGRSASSPLQKTRSKAGLIPF